ncbi:uncharacterized protein LOC134183756 isoform X2 [Corticium candelabrum]|uniref:uncharacterized protein LOC134183756 isoform X2 n=1 Tax=Corticium candelabrum TaxID=121492 RepID=UPI002E26E7AE|nr:uncharacterized protein LOC134183756 isoform X2 [Corticium candelabrum]
MSVKLLGLKVVASRQIFCRQKTAGTAAVGEIINSCERGAWVTVQWQTTGEKQNYYKDENGLFALKILSSESVQVANPLKGTRWTCTRCLQFDLCTKCYCCGLDHQDHKFERFVTDTADGHCKQRIQCRLSFTKTCMLPSPKPLNVRDWNIKENWRRWRQMWTSYEMASRMNSQPSEYRIASLITCLGEEVLEIFNSLTFDSENEIQKIDRHKFNQRNQQGSESFDAYVTYALLKGLRHVIMVLCQKTFCEIE